MYRAGEVAEKLKISPATLRLWSNQFSAFLSPSARKGPTDSVSAQRRYVDEDVELLFQAKAILGRGLTYGEARRKLEELRRENAEGGELERLFSSLPASLDGVREMLGARDRTIAALKETLAVREQTVAALEDTLLAKEKTIAALKDSLQFLEVYVRTLQSSRAGGGAAGDGGLGGGLASEGAARPGSARGAVSSSRHVSPASVRRGAQQGAAEELALDEVLSPEDGLAESREGRSWVRRLLGMG